MSRISKFFQDALALGLAQYSSDGGNLIRPNGTIASFITGTGVGQFRRRPGMVALAATASTSAGGWFVDSGATLSLVPSTVSASGFAVRVTCPNTTGVLVTLRRKIVIANPNTMSGKIEFGSYVPPNVGAGFTINIVASSDTPAADPPTVTASNRASFLWQPSQVRTGFEQVFGVNLTAPNGQTPDLSTPQNVSMTGTPDLYNIHQIQIGINFPGGAGADMYCDIGDISFGANSTPMVMLGWDGGGEYPSHHQYIVPLLEEFNMRATFSPQGQIIDACSLELLRMYAAGHDISNEGLNHTDYSVNPSTLLADFAATRAKLNGYGMTRASNIATMPRNAILSGYTSGGAGAKDLLSAGYIGIRASNKWTIPTPATGHGTGLYGAYGYDQQNATQIDQFIQSLILLGESGLLLGHDLVASGTPGSLQITLSTLTSVLESLANYRAQGLINICTMSEFYGGIF